MPEHHLRVVCWKGRFDLACMLKYFLENFCSLLMWLMGPCFSRTEDSMLKVKINVMLSLCLIKIHVQIHVFLTSELVEGKWSASCPCCFTPIYIYKQILYPPATRTLLLVVQPVASRCTDCATAEQALVKYHYICTKYKVYTKE
jgi:hypothetical protein